ncbi:hypothetical protein C5N14_01600 [Micromonospora sp. MW-13]|uniref:hypothetical protein n=1 Tax=unclassified Micromonospora TaxID=2617518 RepID=UPI000ED34AE1|nr:MULTISPECIES: hypothetical protein [unclassified Micromonospora]MCX4469887.1 hypothetical protein [Micromonospora sp. NBC_01655]RGC70815.1 hypothetical protein C5N14_01600 [Micromonospora sp. MW-13]
MSDQRPGPAEAPPSSPAPGAGPAEVSASPSAPPGGGVPETAGALVDRDTLRLALVVGGLVLAVLLGFGLGRLNPPPADATGRTSTAATDHPHAPGTGAHEHGTGTDTGGATEVGGLAVGSGGWTLAPLSTAFAAGRPGEFRFQVRDVQGRPVTRFAVVHDKPMHLIVVRRDLSGYQHLHPTMAADGTWSVPLTLPQAGAWRAYADFTLVTDDGGQSVRTLGVDLSVPGDYAPRPLPAPTRTATVDGFTVSWSGEPRIGATRPLRFAVRAGDVTPTLERYLGAYGHLVALREGDLGYLHVHPEPGPAPDGVTFQLTVPGPGRYRLYFDFQVAGEVRTAEFTLTAP